MQGMHYRHNVNYMQEMQDRQTRMSAVQPLLTARQVQDVLGVDRSTIYRMAEDGRLPAIRVGKQWRFARGDILAMLDAVAHTTPPRHPLAIRSAASSVDRVAATVATVVASELLGVMMLVTDMTGQPLTAVANPCQWFVEHPVDTEAMRFCTAEWRELADTHDLTPRFRLGNQGFECAQSFIRRGTELVGMVLAGGVSELGKPSPDLYSLTESQRVAVLEALPRIAAAISSQSAVKLDQQLEEAK